MKLLLDMPVSFRVAESLRQHGHDAVHIRERGRQTASDEEILGIAAAEDRILVSMDLDFSQLIATRSLAWPSLILFRIENVKPIEVFNLLLHIIQTYSAELDGGAILSVTDTYIRIRNLPIK